MLQDGVMLFDAITPHSAIEGYTCIRIDADAFAFAQEFCISVGMQKLFDTFLELPYDKTWFELTAPHPWNRFAIRATRIHDHETALEVTGDARDEQHLARYRARFARLFSICDVSYMGRTAKFETHWAILCASPGFEWATNAAGHDEKAKEVMSATIGALAAICLMLNAGGEMCDVEHVKIKSNPKRREKMGKARRSSYVHVRLNQAAREYLNRDGDEYEKDGVIWVRRHPAIYWTGAGRKVAVLKWRGPYKRGQGDGPKPRYWVHEPHSRG